MANTALLIGGGLFLLNWLKKQGIALPWEPQIPETGMRPSEPGPPAQTVITPQQGAPVRTDRTSGLTRDDAIEAETARERELLPEGTVIGPLTVNLRKSVAEIVGSPGSVEQSVSTYRGQQGVALTVTEGGMGISTLEMLSPGVRYRFTVKAAVSNKTGGAVRLVIAKKTGMMVSQTKVSKNQTWAWISAEAKIADPRGRVRINLIMAEPGLSFWGPIRIEPIP